MKEEIVDERPLQREDACTSRIGHSATAETQSRRTRRNSLLTADGKLVEDKAIRSLPPFSGCAGSHAVHKSGDSYKHRVAL